MKIYFIRHGQPDYRTDSLTELGWQHAKETAGRVKNSGISEIYSSTMGRAMQTASVTAEELGLPITPVHEMREIGWGSANGEPIEENGHPWNLVPKLVQRGVNVYDLGWRDFPEFSNNTVIMHTGRAVTGGDAWLESLGYKREGDFYRVTRDDTDKTVALFSHGGSSTALIAHMLNIAFPAMCVILRPYFCAITVVRLPDTPGELVMPTVDLMSDSSHVTRENANKT